MRFFYDNIVALQVAIVCCAFAWLFGGSMGQHLMPTMPWLFAILCEAMICFPQRHAGETTYEARARVWRHLRSDPLLWLVIFFSMILIIPFFNKGLCMSCDYPEIVFDGHPAAPPIAFIPFCVNRAEHLNVVLWFVPALAAMLAVKHALLKRGKRALLAMIVWNGVLLALLGMVQYVSGAKGPFWSDVLEGNVYFFSTFGYPNMAGDYFVVLFCLAVALWRWDVEAARKEAAAAGGAVSLHGHKAFWRQHLHLIPAFILFVASLMTLCRMAMGAVCLLALIFYVHSFVSFSARLKKVQRVKVMAVNLVIVVILSTVGFVFWNYEEWIKRGQERDLVDAAKTRETMSASTPSVAKTAKVDAFASQFEMTEADHPDEDDLRLEQLLENASREAKTISGGDFLDRASGHANPHVAIAWRVWKDHPFFGCGGWGYKHFSIDKMTDEEFDHKQTDGGTNVHNDYLQFLAEHGVVGLLCFLGFIAMLVWPTIKIWSAMINAVRFIKAKDQPPKPVALFALPAPAFFILLAALTTMIHALIDCPLRSPAVLTLFFVSLAAADGFLPRIRGHH